MFCDWSTPVRLPPFWLIASLQLAYGVPSGLRGVGSVLSGALPSISAEKGTPRQSVVKSGTDFIGSALRRCHGVFPSAPTVVSCATASSGTACKG